MVFAALARAFATGATGGDLAGTDGDDRLIGGPQADSIFGGSGNDWIEGGEGDDVIPGGPGVDRLLGGPGAVRFVFDSDAAETDEILDFNPEEGDEIWITPPAAARQSIEGSLRLRRRSIDLELDDAYADRVQLNFAGDVEIRFDDREWHRLVRTGRSRLEIRVTQELDHIRLHFSNRF